ncbi:hypothetical protein TWF696_002522 [Orbilia brochopaga]|uniref:Uncharacterized protein n=1 Tax=Orbilia brochopaga TaxID=3140254 RepID=A0AAV9U1Y1_9PEZI
MLQPKPARGTTVGKYQNALNWIPEVVKRQHPNYRWQVIPGRASMSWQKSVILPPTKAHAPDQSQMEYSNHRVRVPGNEEEYTVEGRSKGETWDWLRSPLLSAGVNWSSGLSGLSRLSKRSMQSTTNAQVDTIEARSGEALPHTPAARNWMPVPRTKRRYHARIVHEAFTSYLGLRAQFEQLRQPQTKGPITPGKNGASSDQCHSDFISNRTVCEAHGQSRGLDAFYQCLGKHEGSHGWSLDTYCWVLEKLFRTLSILRNQISEVMELHGPEDEEFPPESTWNWLLEAVEMLQATSPEDVERRFHQATENGQIPTLDSPMDLPNSLSPTDPATSIEKVGVDKGKDKKL